MGCAWSKAEPYFPSLNGPAWPKIERLFDAESFDSFKLDLYAWHFARLSLKEHSRVKWLGISVQTIITINETPCREPAFSYQGVMEVVRLPKKFTHRVICCYLSHSHTSYSILPIKRDVRAAWALA